MLQRRQDLPLFQKPLHGAVVELESVPQELERDALVKLRVVPFGEIDDAHAPAPDRTQEPILADARVGKRFAGSTHGRTLQKIARTLSGIDHASDLRT